MLQFGMSFLPYPPPGAPAVTSPADGASFAEGFITVAGTTSEVDGRHIDAEVNGVIQLNVATTSGGTWSGNILVYGVTSATVRVRTRTAEGVLSSWTATRTFTITVAAAAALSLISGNPLKSPAKPTVSGTVNAAAANGLVRVYMDGGLVTTTTAGGSSPYAWTASLDAVSIGDGAHSVQVTVQPTNWSVSPSSSIHYFVKSASLPDPTQVNSNTSTWSASGTIPTMTLSGTAWNIAGAQVQLLHSSSYDNTRYTRAVANLASLRLDSNEVSIGDYSISYQPTGLYAGTHYFDILLSGSAGTWQGVSPEPWTRGLTATVTEVAPPAPTEVYYPAPGEIMYVGNILSASGYTRNGTTVEVYWTGTLVSTQTFLSGVPGQADSYWTYQKTFTSTDITAVGMSSSLTARARGTDNQYSGYMTKNFEVRSQPPGVPTLTYPTGGTFIVQQVITLTGTGTPGCGLIVYEPDGVTERGRTTIDGAGNWSYANYVLPAYPAGYWALRIRAYDAWGTTSNEGGGGVAVAFNAPFITTSATTTTINNNVTVAGTGHANTGIKVYRDGNGTPVATTTTDGAGNWSVTLSTSGLSYGNHTYVARHYYSTNESADSNARTDYVTFVTTQDRTSCFGSCETAGTGCTAGTQTVTVGGSGVTVSTYSWSKVSGDTYAVSNPSAASTSFSKTASNGGSEVTYSAVYRCALTSNTGIVAYAYVNVSTTHLKL